LDKLSKFPVTTPEGTEYRVTIEHEQERNIFGDVLREYYDIRLYVPRKNALFVRFKRIGKYWAEVEDGDSFINIATWTVAKYENEQEIQRQKRDKQAEQQRAQVAAVEAFRKWDGKITNQTEVSE